MTQARPLILSLLRIWSFRGYLPSHLSLVCVPFGCLLVFVCSEHLFIHGFCLLMKSGYCLLSMSALTDDDDNDGFVSPVLIPGRKKSLAQLIAIYLGKTFMPGHPKG